MLKNKHNDNFVPHCKIHVIRYKLEVDDSDQDCSKPSPNSGFMVATNPN